MSRINKTASTFFLVVVLMAITAMAAIEDDEKDCADQLANLAGCIPYVSGEAAKPTPQCCKDTLQVKTTMPKCLCVLIKESADPALGLPINTTLALQMPSACNIDAKVSDCPTLLKLPADSPDAKIFKQAGSGAGSGSGSSITTDSTPTASTASPSTPASTSTPATNSKTTESSNGGGKTAFLASGSLLALVASVSWVFII